MTKISIDPMLIQGERHTSGSIDLARRFEWRLQWEKSQLEHWQSYQQVCNQQGEQNKPQSENHISNDHTVEQLSSRPLRADDRISGHIELKQSHQLKALQHQPANGSAMGMGGNSTTNLSAAIPSNSVDRAQQAISNSPKTMQQVHNMSMSRQQVTPNMHIYQMDGSVEIALRNTGMNSKEGIKLMTGLRRDLISLGLRLTRLTLNGELFWQSESISPNHGVPSVMDEAPIDKIY
jgi:hypothetical protein